jgi:acetyl esterase/lipase
VLGLVLLGIQTYRNPRVRRTVGVVWDLATFWPRAAHPLAPPCYSERVVPELVHRGTWLAKEQNGLVVSGHSQGSVLAAATVLQLPPEARARTALITYGSPLCRLYMRAFPNYFNEKVINDISAAVADSRGRERWINLWRRTDPIGGAVGLGDRRLADPISFDQLPGDRIPPAPQAHGGYQLTPQFGQAMDDLVGLLRESTTPMILHASRSDDHGHTDVV